MSIVVNIAGVAKVGTTYVAKSVARELEKKGVTVSVVKLKDSKELIEWEDNYLLGRYKMTDVFIIDRHPLVAKMANKRLKDNRFADDNVKMDLSFLLTAEVEDYHRRLGDTDKENRRFSLANQLDYHKNMPKEFYNSRKALRVIDTSGSLGLLVACGQVRDEILRELKVFK